MGFGDRYEICEPLEHCIVGKAYLASCLSVYNFTCLSKYIGINL